MMKRKNSRKKITQKLLLRLELWFAPALIIVPILVSLFFVWDWYLRGFSIGSSVYDGELILGLLLLLGNFFFDVLFIKSLRIQKQQKD